MPKVIEILIIYAILIFSVVCHELGHAYVALINGDPTARNMGRLTFNPLKHLDLFGSFILPLLLYFTVGFAFGYAKPVPINTRLFRNYKHGLLTTSVAGVLMNFTLAFFGVALFRTIASFSPPSTLPFYILRFVLLHVVYINVLLGFFNILPLPPLDGWHVVESLVPSNYAVMMKKVEPYSIIVFAVAIYFGLFYYVFIPIQFIVNFLLFS
ncbi:site-2 protease family protein [Candidatus Margulisiibacteriota bacterium]